MADVQPPQRLDPQDIVKLLMALRRALKTKPA
ncbi:MarR family transcriptional regulator [Pseudomonas sp. IT-P4]